MIGTRLLGIIKEYIDNDSDKYKKCLKRIRAFDPQNTNLDYDSPVLEQHLGYNEALNDVFAVIDEVIKES
jgi:hypothetical protein